MDYKLLSEFKFAKTAQEEAEKINAQTGAGYVTDQEFWARQGINTGEELAISVVNQTYSDLYKELHGFRPKHKSFVSVEEAQKAINDLDDAYNVMIDMERMDVEVQAAYEAERLELEELMPGQFDFEEVPKSSGMGRRMESKIRITIDDLEKIINEAIDGHPYDGPIERWADIASTKWGHGSVVDPQGWKDSCKLGGKFTKGKAPSILSPKRLNISENEIRAIVRAALIEQVEAPSVETDQIELTSGKNISPAQIMNAWPDNITHGGKNVFQTFYSEGGIQSANSMLRMEGYDGQEVYLGYSPGDDIFVMGFDAFLDEDDLMDGVAIELTPDGDAMDVLAVTPDGMYPAGLRSVEREIPDIIHLRLD